ncbi:hypothetical protein [Aquimarina sediminis]|uniref:hypothetical protein n=1 Tax=Aquimarina sediminis TaxID=2070536 RepID=UPI000CA087D7|nr:hypothetical protein [Aquimarina sediminis]
MIINNLLTKKSNVFLFALTLALLTNYSSFSQKMWKSEAPANQQGRNLKLDDLFNQVKKLSKEDILANIKGSPYLSENFTQGDVYFEADPVGKLYMRYNAFSDEIEVKKNTNDKDYSALIKSKLINCNLNQQQLIYSTYKPIDKMAEEGYLISLTNPSNSYTLYKRIKTIFKDRGVEQATSLSKVSEAKFSTFTTYYLLAKDSKEAKQLPKKQKKISSLFPEQDRSVISDYIKEQNINPKKEKDLIKLINFVNGLGQKI